MMTEIALVADLHGNWPATEAVDRDIRQRGIRRIWCLGRDQFVQAESGKLARATAKRLFRSRISVQDHAVASADDHTVRQVAVYSIESPGSEADLSVLRSFPSHVFRASFLSKIVQFKIIFYFITRI